MQRGDIDQIRRFNRLVTQRAGALEQSYLARGRPLGEARLVYEVGAAGGEDLKRLRHRLGLDAGYFSRLLRSLEAQGLTAVSRDGHDGRRRRVTLTEQGRAEHAAYEALSDRLAESLIGDLEEAQMRRLVDAMAEIEHLLKAAAFEIAVEPSDSLDARWCLAQYFAELSRRFENGFDPAVGGPAGAEAGEGDRFLVARLEGEPVGCGALKMLSPGIGEIKRVWCAERVRGMGLAKRLVRRLETIAAESGVTRLRLDTNRALVEAHRLYRRLGYVEIAAYNDNPYAHLWFEKVLVPGQSAGRNSAADAI